MTILIACDSFKDACSSIEACEAIERGLKKAKQKLNIDRCPISDGGEGAVTILQFHLGGMMKTAKTANPLFKLVDASYLLLDPDNYRDKIAIIEMAQTCGLELLDRTERNPMNTSTFGTGELVKDAIANGCQQIIITVGGSATNDLGMGMASALGYQFFDDFDNTLAPIGANMIKVKRIEFDNFISRDEHLKFIVITDVANPLYGDDGAAFTFAKQKGANSEEIAKLDQGLQHLSKVIIRDLDKDISSVKGAGAAGGLAGGCVAFLNAEITSGFEKISELIELNSKIKTADIIITGEGHFDSQTKGGKVIKGISDLAKLHGKPLVVFCGQKSIDDKTASSMGINDIVELSEINSDFDLEVALVQTTRNLEDKARMWAENNLKSEM